MFKKARIKLTVVYSGIIMAISIAFSLFIYRMVSVEIQQRLSLIERRLNPPQRIYLPPTTQNMMFIEDLREVEDRVLIILIYTNVVILIFSSLAGYFLAGLTLHPIENAMEEQKRFIADASHELKTPLTALQTSIEVALRDKKIDLKSALFTLKDSLNDVKSMTSLTNDLLSLTRYQQNNLKESFARVNLKDIVETSVNKIRPLGKSKGMQIEFNKDDVFLSGNKESLEKLITILLDNAVKYSQKKKMVNIKYNCKGKYIIIAVSDNGIGIPKEDLPYLFERFYRSDASRSKINTLGFGLGLSIAKSIVNIHNGSIGVESTVGKGSIFTVKLPAE